MKIDIVQKTVKFIHIVKMPELSTNTDNILSVEDAENLVSHFSACKIIMNNALNVLKNEDTNKSLVVFKDLWQLQDNLKSFTDADIIILSGDTECIEDFVTFSDAFWYQNQKLVVDDKYKNMVMNSPEEFYVYHTSQYAKKVQSANAIWKSDEHKRITKLAHLMNQDMTIVEIAKEMNVTRSAIYLMRNQYREQLEALVDRGKRAMRFNK